MSLTQKERDTIVALQLEKADRFMAEAETCADLQLWDVTSNRLYYSTFHAVAALLVHDGLEVRSHKGAGIIFGQKYITTGIFPVSDGRLYSKLQDLREKNDYNLVYRSTESEIRPLIEDAKSLIERIRNRV